MTGDQFASPPCFLHELDPGFIAAGQPEKPTKAAQPASRADCDENFVKTVPKDR
ncbi:MAG: hypothetical protein AAF563_02965 [Pseudomonadota bacterium]